MPKTLLMYDKALQRIGDRLRGEALDLTLATFDRSGTIDVAGRKLAATEFAPDYVWLSSDINLDKFQDGAFACVETLRSVGYSRPSTPVSTTPSTGGCRRGGRPSATRAPRPSPSRSM